MPPMAVHAHDEGTVCPVSLTFGFGLQSLHADNRWPVARLPGILESGNPLADDTGTRASHLEIDLHIELPDDHVIEIATAKHAEGDSFSVEKAWLGGQVMPGNVTLDYRIGRQYVPLGWLNLAHSHSREFGIDPLVMRALFNNSLLGDGARLDLALRPDVQAGIGLWLSEGHPASPDDAPNLITLRGGWTPDNWAFELGLAHARADGRALSTVGDGRHTHTLPSCGTLDANRVCFAGETDLASVAAQWTARYSPAWIRAEWFIKRDRGNLDSLYGTPSYRGIANGGWIDFGYHFSDSLNGLLRLEQTRARHDLSGADAGLVASQSGIVESDAPLRSFGLGVNWTPGENHLMGAEWRRVDLGEKDTDDVFMLRYQFHFGEHAH